MSSRWQDEVLADVASGVRINDQHIVDRIRQAVLMQRLPPNTRLPEVALGDIFGVSRSVVRKALTRLAADHVITQQPNQVARVSAPSVDETREIFAARRLVEGEVVALLALEPAPSWHARLSELCEAEADAHARGDEPQRIEHSLALHHTLAEHSPNRILGAMLGDLILRTSIVIALYKHSGLASCYLEGDHPRLRDALAAGDSAAARAALHAHLDSLEALLDLRPQTAQIDLAAIFAQPA
ncbi:GntR family transcriptional regulator [Franzmannia qiaohouensis]|uniref:GntR family transcriptional regulator n=1 Tax=Franzmannia qiaohouensis TaxID=1329370 RepID=A0ABU1HED2_9GAMM|nr:GntR family transcriptional regulator [Halomonas qiaohouensis]MDR5905823.1 GntR family transcriptional regulator [Halomonas qiaohouensis]